MELRSRINAAMKQAMKDKSTERLSTIRLINAAIKDRDIAARTEGKENGVADDEVLAILAKMTKQRQESAKTYEEAGRLDLSERELSEIKVIEEFLPTQLSEDEIKLIEKDQGPRVTITGKAGTVVVFESSTLHRGRPIELGERLALTNYYYPQNAKRKEIFDNFNIV